MAISFPVNFIGAQSVANPLTKAYGAPVVAGDVLVAFIAIYNAAETCTGVSDSVNGAWTQAFGPINAGNGTRMYGFYKLNSAAGTPTVSASFSNANHHEIEISVISGLAGGGAFDQEAHAANLSTNPSVGPTAALGATVCAAVAAQYNSGVVPSANNAGWTLDGNLDLGWQKASFLRQATANNSALTASWTQGNSYWNAGIMVFKDAVSQVDGTAPAANVTGTSSIQAGQATGGSNNVDGTAPAANVTGPGTINAGQAFATASGSFTTETFENAPGSPHPAGTLIYWEWRVGPIGQAPTSVTYGPPGGTPLSGNGTLTLTGLPLGAGELWARDAGTGRYMQSGTVT